jgi:predicted TIM-barrel fold metal-dependent hydrolase
MKKQSGTAPMSNNAELKQLLLDKEIELRDAKRQLEVEVALEKVRSLTMVMKRSDDLSDIILIVYKELRKLDIALTRTLIWLFNENPDMFEVWMADTEADTTPFVMKQEVEHPYHKRMFDAWKKRRSKWVYINEGEGKKDLDDYLFTKTAAVALPEEVKAGIRALNRIVNSFSFHNFGCLQADGAEELSEENFEIMYRFAKEFDLAYIRFLDLKKAEALAREAQIEASLERVRARSMAMHNSEELLDVAKQLYQELEDLGVPQYMTGFVEVDKINQKQKVWVTAPNGQRMESFFLPLKGDAILKTRHNSWLKQDPIFYQKVTGEALKKHLLYVSKHYESAEAVEIGNQFPDKIIFYCGNFSEGYLHILSEVKLDKEQESILQKFTKVFSITYRRFLDLKLAEEQAREAKIEAALEQVRTRSMAMHSSEELSEVAYVLFEKLKELGVQLQWCWFSIFDEDLKGMKAWYTDTDGQFNPTPIHQKIKDFEDVGSSKVPR